ncbi:hypothetical protein [Tenacibaculum ovolyticum]|uniref:hypothetical protein n=1 Tax=Tenacibaculum ovolyticum TaxID=104270 RepID=UPI003BABD04B
MNKYSFIVYFVIAFTCVLFYSHRFIEPDSNLVVKIKAEHSLLKKARNSALAELEKKTSDSLLVTQYLIAKKKADNAWGKLKKAKKSQTFFGFRSLHYFLERFGLASLIFIYGAFNLIRSFYYDRKNFSSKLFHVFVISVGFFYFFWVFNTFQDFSKATYFLATFTSASFLAFGIYLFTKFKQSKINKLKGDIREISRFTVLNTKPGKQKEMFSLFNKLLRSK